MIVTTLPAIREAKLPATYEQAKDALQKCSNIDECKSWADKAAALASYAKQADDKSLQHLAERIRARAIERCGELLKEIELKHTGRPPENRAGGGPNSSRAQAARDAGMSDRERKTAIRVASVPHRVYTLYLKANSLRALLEHAPYRFCPSRLSNRDRT